MVARHLKTSARVIIALVSIMLIIIGVVAVRLAWGPISLEVVKPYIEDAASAADGSYRLRIKDAVLTWGGFDRGLDILVDGIEAVDANRESIGRIERVAVGLSGWALLEGRLAPRYLEVFAPTIKIVRLADGSLEMDQGADTRSGGGVELLLSEIIAKPDKSKPTGYLRRLIIRDGDLYFDDRLRGTVWHAPKADVELMRNREGLRGNASLPLALDGEPANIQVNGFYRRADRHAEMEVTFLDIKPAFAARAVPVLEPLKGLDVPLSGAVSLSMDRRAVVKGGSFNISFGAGRAEFKEPVGFTARIQGGELHGRYDVMSEAVIVERLAVDFGDEGRIFFAAPMNHALPAKTVEMQGRFNLKERSYRLDRLSADLRGPDLSLSASMEPPEAGGKIAIEAAFDNLAVNALNQYWIPGVGNQDPRDWVLSHLSNGTLKDAFVKINMKALPDGSIDDVDIDGSFRIEGSDISYLEELPSVTAVDANATFDGTGFRFEVLGGEHGGLSVDGGTVILTGLDQPTQTGDIRAEVSGSLRRILELVDTHPQKLISSMGLTPANMEGRVDTTLRFKLPLRKGLDLADVDTGVEAEITEAGLKDAFAGQDATGGTFDLNISKNEMRLRGAATLGDIPVRLAVARNFPDAAPFRNRVRFRAQISDSAQIEALGVSDVPVAKEDLKGPLEGDLVFVFPENKPARLANALKASDGKVLLAKTKEETVPDQSARVRPALIDDPELANDKPPYILFALSGVVRSDGVLFFEPASETLKKITLETVQTPGGRMDAAGTIRRLETGEWSAHIRGESVDISPYFESVTGEDEEAGTAVNLTLDAKKVWTGADRHLEDVEGSFIYNGEELTYADFKGTAGKERKKLSLRIFPDQDTRKIQMDAEDAGAALYLLDLYDNMRGGKLALRGRYDLKEEGHPIKGRIDVSDYRIVNAPALAKVLSIMALSGIVESLQGDGLKFSDLRIPFIWKGGRVWIKDGKASGISLGVTFEGLVNRNTETVDMKGTIVPIHGLNTLIGKIPILGDLATGGDKESGLFAARYTMKGPAKDPDVNVNALSALAPGFLRNLFNVFESEGPPTEPGKSDAPSEQKSNADPVTGQPTQKAPDAP